VTIFIHLPTVIFWGGVLGGIFISTFNVFGFLNGVEESVMIVSIALFTTLWHHAPIVFLQNMLLSLMIFVTCVWDSSPASTKCSAQFLKQILKLQAEYPECLGLPSLIKPLIRDAITLSKDE